MKKFLLISLLFVFVGCSSGDWRNASREPAGIAPLPAQFPEAVIEVYAADAFGWRGWFAVHTWIAVKPEQSENYTVYEVVGWRVDDGHPALRVYETPNPDRYWYGARPERILSIQGGNASELILAVEKAVSEYPWANEYQAVPGPNSNTLPAWVALQVPELELQLPFNAIGKGYAKRAIE